MDILFLITRIPDKKKKKRTTTIFPLRSPFNTKNVKCHEIFI